MRRNRRAQSRGQPQRRPGLRQPAGPRARTVRRRQPPAKSRRVPRRSERHAGQSAGNPHGSRRLRPAQRLGPPRRPSGRGRRQRSARRSATGRRAKSAVDDSEVGAERNSSRQAGHVLRHGAQRRLGPRQRSRGLRPGSQGNAAAEHDAAGQTRSARRDRLDAGDDSPQRRSEIPDGTHAHGRGRDWQRGHGPLRRRRLGPLDRHPAAIGRRDYGAEESLDRRSGDVVDYDFQSRHGRGHRRGVGRAHSARLAASGRQRVGVSGGRPEAGREPQARPAGGGQSARCSDESPQRPRRRQPEGREQVRSGSAGPEVGRRGRGAEASILGAPGHVRVLGEQSRHRLGPPGRTGGLACRKG